MGRLDGKVAIITGAAGGMGLVAAKLFYDEGAKVVATDFQEEKLKANIAKLNEEGRDIQAVALDVRSEENWKAVVDFTVEKYGKVTTLINNAGFASWNQVCESTYEEWLNDYGIDIAGQGMGMKYCIPEMRKAGGGSIVNTSSSSAFSPDDACGVAYATAKGATVSMSKHIAVKEAKNNIRVNVVIPGAFYTDGIAALGMTHEQMAAKFVEKAPLPPHAANPIEIAYAYLYFASDESKFVTGASLAVDGGMTI